MKNDNNFYECWEFVKAHGKSWEAFKKDWDYVNNSLQPDWTPIHDRNAKIAPNFAKYSTNEIPNETT